MSLDTTETSGSVTPQGGDQNGTGTHHRRVAVPFCSTDSTMIVPRPHIRCIFIFTIITVTVNIYTIAIDIFTHFKM